jgi:farnesyl-diphosphate farnesyltransferase
MDSRTADGSFQERILPRVSRTFALTIPQLPMPLRETVANAYLLCRIADTIEDEPALSPAETQFFLQRFTSVVAGNEPARVLAREVGARLTERTLPAERELVTNMEHVTVGARLGAQCGPVVRCIELMCDGMHHFQRTASVRGLTRSADLDSYCYYVAGVVGEMLTELFCQYSPLVAAHKSALDELAASFGEGLQLTNILKDFWEDRARGACWLPQEVFTPYGVELAQLTPGRPDPRFHAGLRDLVGVAHGHLRNALTYSLTIPSQETGIRRFCLWAVGLAILTLRKIVANPHFTSGTQVKISRNAVRVTRLCTIAAIRNDRILRALFDHAARGLPLVSPAAARRAAVRAAAQAAATHQADSLQSGRTQRAAPA